MFDFYVSYNNQNSKASAEATQIISGLKEYGNYVGGSSNIEARLIEAEYLIVVFGSDDEFSSPALAKDYNFFLEELKWKRKQRGSIIMFLPPDVNLRKVPFKLKNCYYFNYGEASGLSQYINQIEHNSKKNIVTKRQMPAKKDIKYTPHPQEVSQIKFSARAPQVKSFDGTINYDARETEGCKDDHVYAVSDPKSYINEEINRPTVISSSSSNANRSPKSKNASCGCMVSIFVGLILVIVGMVFVTMFINKVGFFSGYENAIQPIICSFDNNHVLSILPNFASAIAHL